MGIVDSNIFGVLLDSANKCKELMGNTCFQNGSKFAQALTLMLEAFLNKDIMNGNLAWKKYLISPIFVIVLTSMRDWG